MIQRHKLLLETLDKLEKGKPAARDAHWCGNTIVQLSKWNMRPKRELNALCKRVTALLVNSKQNDI